jgi:hypothetical protein
LAECIKISGFCKPYFDILSRKEAELKGSHVREAYVFFFPSSELRM